MGYQQKQRVSYELRDDMPTYRAVYASSSGIRGNILKPYITARTASSDIKERRVKMASHTHGSPDNAGRRY